MGPRGAVGRLGGRNAEPMSVIYHKLGVEGTQHSGDGLGPTSHDDVVHAIPKPLQFESYWKRLQQGQHHGTDKD
jgi:hypothetical protein